MPEQPASAPAPVNGIPTALPPYPIPPLLESVFRNFWTCEFTTLDKAGRPITWPTLPVYRAQTGQILILTSVGLAQKVTNVRRNPRVALLFSDPTGSGLSNPPAILVQGDASSPDRIYVKQSDYDEALAADVQTQARKLFDNQPGINLYVNNRVMRYLMDWYFMRLVIFVTPRRILWWENRDFGLTPQEWER